MGATADGALGFWKALRKVYPTTRVQRCWVHKTSNVLNKIPKSAQAKTMGCGSRIACLTMVFKLALSAEKKWRALNGAKLLADVIDGVVFEDGVRKEAA